MKLKNKQGNSPINNITVNLKIESVIELGLLLERVQIKMIKQERHLFLI